jgi:uncharacterized protein YbbK (DUF523 family)
MYAKRGSDQGITTAALMALDSSIIDYQNLSLLQVISKILFQRRVTKKSVWASGCLLYEEIKYAGKDEMLVIVG